MSRAVLRATLFELLESLQRQSDILKESLLADGVLRYAWVVGGANEKDARAKAAKAIGEICFPKVGVTHGLVGLVGVSHKTLRVAIELNQIKDRFQQASIELRTYEGGNKRKEVRDVFVEAGIGDLSLRQVYRHALLVDPVPLRIGFTWLRTQRSIKSITKEEAVNFLGNTLPQGFPLDHALHTVDLLDTGVPLYIAYDVKPHVRANILMPDKTLRTLVAHSPILFIMDEGGRCPEHNKPPEEAPDPVDRIPRKDRVVGHIPLIPGLPLYVGSVTDA